LDGLVANVEATHDYTEPPLRRMSRRFEFPQLKKPGVYVVDFIGSGKSSRSDPQRPASALSQCWHCRAGGHGIR